MVKILIIGDLHGRPPNIHFKDFDAVLSPGDFCSSEFRDLKFKTLREKQRNPDYNKQWYDLIGKRRARQGIQNNLRDGRRILEILNKLDVPVFVVPGNADYYEKDSDWDYERKNHYRELIRGLNNIKDCHKKLRQFLGYQIIGYGGSYGPEYPQHKREVAMYSKQKLRKKRDKYHKDLSELDSLFEEAKGNGVPVIFLSHNVPLNTKLDKITDKRSPKYGQHSGSLIASETIEKHQPLLSEGSHIHEIFDKIMIGRTTCINSGFGPDANVLVELKGNKIKSVRFHNKQS